MSILTIENNPGLIQQMTGKRLIPGKNLNSMHKDLFLDSYKDSYNKTDCWKVEKKWKLN